MMSAVKGVGDDIGSLRTWDIRLKKLKNPSGQGPIITHGFARANGVAPGSEHWEGYQLAQKLWKPGGLVLNREILYRAGDEYWNHFFLMPDARTWKQHDIERGGDKTSHSPQNKQSGGSSSGGGQSAASTAQPD